jgi:hypothetical protein
MISHGTARVKGDTSPTRAKGLRLTASADSFAYHNDGVEIASSWWQGHAALS